jgi:hypothetical protein
MATFIKRFLGTNNKSNHTGETTWADRKERQRFKRELESWRSDTFQNLFL